MSTIQPISTTRVTGQMTRGRLTSQIQSDQLDLFRLQNQLSTGFRIFLPSDDAPAAQRAMVLQRTIDRKEQSLSNLKGAQRGLGTTEAGLASLNTLLNDIKGNALGAVGNFASQQEREGLISDINQAISAVQRAGNTTFTSTYLVGGAERSSEAFEAVRGYIEYWGDESTPRTFVDIGQLFDSGTSGHDALGGFSESVRGSADLNLQLTPETRLSKLNGGLGVSPNGSIEVTYTPALPSDPSTFAVIDLSNARTIDDVARLIESGAPDGSGLVVSVQGNALRVDAAAGGITINESANGQTARELGIITTGSPTPSVAGTDLNPTIEATDRLEDLAGAKARGRIVSVGFNNDIVLTATQNGAEFNGLTVNYVDGASAGNESAAYDGPSNTLTVTIAADESNAIDIAQAINDSGVPFTAEIDYRDQTSLNERGTGPAAASPALSPVNLAVGVAGGADGGLDLSAGFLVTNGDETYAIDTSGAETVEDLLSELNRPRYGLMATINTTGDGIDVRTRRSGADFTIAENGGTTAADLGILTFTADSRLADFNRGEGVLVEGINEDDTLTQNPFTIVVTEDGLTNEYTIDPRGLETVDDVLQAINTETGGAVAATLNTVGNGIVLNVTDPDSPATFATGSFGLGADTLTITADATGAEGNRPFTVEVIDSGGAGPLQTTVVGDTITVDLQGVAATTDAIASDIQGQLAGFTVSSVAGGGSFDTISAAVGPISAATTNGAAASNLAAAASGEFTLNGDTITLNATTTGSDGNLPLAVEVIDSGGAGPLLTSFDPATGTVTVDLQGVDTSTDAIAASIEAQLSDPDDGVPDFTVASSGTTAVATTDVPGLPVSFDATTSGGQATDSITVSGGYAERLGFFSAGEDSVTSTEGEIISEDRNVREVDSIFTTLIRMRDALEAGDDEAFEREVNRIDTDIDRVTFTRAEIGTRLQNLEAIETRLANEDVTLRSALSDEIDADLVEVISDFTAKQASLQASLQISGALLNLSILDFI